MSSVDRVLKQFTKAISKLEAIATNEEQNAIDAQNAADRMLANKAKAENEAARARRVAGNLKSIAG